MTWGEPREVLSDDADIDRVGGYRLSIFMGGNGDWYVSILAPDERLGPCVRLRTSGGAASDFPGLCVAISNAYRALGHETEASEYASKMEAIDLLEERETFDVSKSIEGEKP